MEKLVYFRMLYEYEKQHDILDKIKEYIHGDNTEIVKKMCAGDLHLPSPFLLDELEWSLNIDDYKVKEIIYQLKVTSREFYRSLVDFKPGQYRMHFDRTSTSFGQQVIYNLSELRRYHSGDENQLLNIGKFLFAKLQFFSVGYPGIFKGMYGLCTLLILLTSWYLCISFQVSDPALALLFPSGIGTITLMSALGLEYKINVFRRSDISGKNVLAMRYREFLVMLKHSM